MNPVACRDWADFRAIVDRYCRLDRLRRDDFWFRGHSSEKHRLITTLDRTYTFEDDKERSNHIEQLRKEFRREAILLGADGRLVNDKYQLDLLARHHGLPSPLLDWTQSPFVAAYFALIDPAHDEHIAIWSLDLSKADVTSGEFELINDQEKLLWNKRALRQRGAFLYVSSFTRSLEDILGSALTKFVIPIGRESRQNALDELDEMMINGTNLFEDYEGAAQTAASRTVR